MKLATTYVSHTPAHWGRSAQYSRTVPSAECISENMYSRHVPQPEAAPPPLPLSPVRQMRTVLLLVDTALPPEATTLQIRKLQGLVDKQK